MSNFVAYPGTNKKSSPFPDPFYDLASRAVPNSQSLALRWAEYFWYSNGTYAQAMRRISRYFVTQLDITATEKEQEDSESKNSFRKILESDVGLLKDAGEVGDNFLAYDNVYAYLYRPFNRYLICPDCGAMVSIDTAHKADALMVKDSNFYPGKKGCVSCGAKKAYKVRDVFKQSAKDINLRMVSPHEVEVEHDLISGKSEYVWNVPDDVVSAIKRGSLLTLKNIPVEMFKAALSPAKKFRFNDGHLFHYWSKPLAGIRSGGQGIPRTVSNFRIAYHYQIINRMDQAVAADYINGMRVISPATTSGGATDPLAEGGGASFASNVHSMIEKHRQDPASWHTAPVPLQYQLFGGEGASLSPYQLLESKQNELLDAVGAPAQWYRCDLTAQSSPLMLRLFQNMHQDIVTLYNELAQFVATRVSNWMGLPDYEVKMKESQFIDDLEVRNIFLQLMAGNQVSPQTALERFGIKSPEHELGRITDWQMAQAKAQKAQEEKMQELAQSDQVSAQMAGMGPDGQPMDSGPAALGDQEAQAEQLAAEIMGMEASARKSTLIDLKKTDPTLHALVKSKIEDAENQGAQQGVDMIRQQAAGGM